MSVCLAVTPFALFGVIGLFRMPVDIISAPAANVALPLGIDEMIHLGLGILVCIGAAITDLVVLVVLPAIATYRHRMRSSGG